MTVLQIAVSTGCALLLVCGFTHSYLGERLLLRPMFRLRGNAVLENDLGRFVLRGAWHLTTLMWVQMAIMLYAVGFAQTALMPVVLLTIGAGFVFAGVFDLIGSKARHVGWPLLLGIGLAACYGWWVHVPASGGGQ